MKRNLIWLPVLCVLIMIIQGYHAEAQEPLLRVKHASLWFGTRNLFVEKLPLEQTLDFFNYANDYEYGEYFLLGISLQLQGRKPWIFSVDAFTSDDIIPTSVRLNFQYKLLPWLGIDAGFIQYPMLLTGYEQYFKLRYTDFYTDGGQYANLRQITIHDYSFTAGPSLHFESKTGFLSINFNLAYSRLLPFIETFSQKKINGNLRQESIYTTTPSSGFFFYPLIILGKNIYHFADASLGLQLQMSTLMGSRSINYTHTLRQWTDSNSYTTEITTNKHVFRLTDISMGIYWRF